MLFVDPLHPLLTCGMVSAEKRKLLFVFIASQAEEAANGLVSHWLQVLMEASFFFLILYFFLRGGGGGCVFSVGFFAALLLALTLIWFSNVSSGLWQAAQQLEFEKAAGGEQSFAESA